MERLSASSFIAVLAAVAFIGQPRCSSAEDGLRRSAWPAYAAGDAVLSGHVLANVSGRGILQVPLSDLARRREYLVRIKCYDDRRKGHGLAGESGGRLVSEQSIALLGGYPAFITDSRTRHALYPGDVASYEAGGRVDAPEPRPVYNANLIVASSDDLSPAAATLMRYGNQPGRSELAWQTTMLEAADSVRCGPLNFRVYQPGATRFEATVSQREVWRELDYAGRLIPDLVERSSEFGPDCWVSCSLQAPGLGFMFADGVLAPTPEEQAALAARVAARTAQLAAESGTG